MTMLGQAQKLAQHFYRWRMALVFLACYALGSIGYYLWQGPSATREMAMLLSVVLVGWVLLAWLLLLLFRKVPDWPPPSGLWQRLKQISHKVYYLSLLWLCLLLSIATLYLMAKALKLLLSQLL